MSDTENTNNGSFQSENISVTVHQMPNCQIKFDIVVHLLAVKAAHTLAIKKVKKEISVPGFRKGKVPEQWILEKYKSAINEECADIAVNAAMEEALRMTHLRPVKNSFKSVKMKQFKPNEELSFSIEFEVYPEVPTINPAELSLQRMEKKPITPEMIDEQLHYLQKQSALYEPILDRGIESRDFARIAVEMIAPAQRPVIEDQQVEVSGHDIPKWLTEAIIGLKAGETAETFNPEEPNVKYKVSVIEVLEGRLPELNDEFAIQSKAESLEDLKQKIRSQLDSFAEEEYDSLRVRQLEDLLLNKYAFDLPPSFIKNDADERVKNYLERIRSEGAGEEWIKENLPSIREQLEKTSSKALQLYLMLHAVIHKHDIAINEEELIQEKQRELIEMIKENRLDKRVLASPEFDRNVRSAALERKVRRFLLDQVTVE